MTEVAAAPNIDEIRAAIVARMQELAPLVAECARLEQAEAALEKAEARLHSNGGRPAGAPDEEAPYGYKADGTPYKRRPPSDPDYARRGWETRRNAAQDA